MRSLTLDEKISIKGELATKGVLPPMLAALDMKDACRMYYACFGRPAATFGIPKLWHEVSRQTKAAAHAKAVAHA